MTAPVRSALPTPAPVPPTPPPAPGLARALLAYVVVVVLVVTLSPFELAMPVAVRARLGTWSLLDVAANVLLFVPVGFLRVLARGERAARLRDAVLLGVLLSAAVELTQLWMPSRYPSPLDVLANGAGAALGALAAASLRRRLDPAAVVGRLALELPLVGAAYLLVPLGALGAMVLAGSDATGLARPAALLALALFGGSVLGAVQRRHLAPARTSSARGMGLVAAIGTLVAIAPALPAQPLLVLPGAVLVGAFTAVCAAAPLADVEDRRFELAALLRAAPLLAAYLLLLALDDAGGGAALERAAILRQLERLAAFTLLGYLAAEGLGRRELRLRHAAPVVVAASTIVAAVGLVLAAGGVPAVRDAWLVPAAALPALYGARLYHVQRAAVRDALLRRSRGTSAAGQPCAPAPLHPAPTPALPGSPAPAAPRP